MSLHPFIAHFAQLDVSRSAAPELRDRARARLQEISVPTRKTEAFRFFDVGRITSQDWTTSATEEAFEPPAVVEAQATTIYVRNGRVTSSPTGLPDGVFVGSFDALPESERGAVVDALSGSGVFDDDLFRIVNDATFADIACVVLREDTSLPDPVRIVHIGTGDGAYSAPRVVVVAARGAKATVIEDFVGDGAHFTNAVSEVVLGESANIHHVRVQRESADARHVSRVVARVGRFARYDSVHVTLGAFSSRNDVWISHEGEDGWSRIDGLAMVDGEGEADTHSVIDNTRVRCTSHQLHKCVVDGRAHAVFNGKIFVRHGAQKIDAYQLNRNLLLSTRARVDTKPQLEILADDVVCSHGATIGQLDDEQLFYLQARGVRPEDARATLTYAFAAEVIVSIAVPSLAAALERIAHDRTMNREAS